jgi:hypothetical protein
MRNIPSCLIFNLRSATALCIAALLTIATGNSSQAATLVTDPGGEVFRLLNPGTAGFQFTLSLTATDLVVTSLGIIDKDGDGLNTSHQIGLWEGSTQLALVTVEAGTANPLINGYRYAELSVPVILTLGGTYTIGAQTTGSDEFRDSGTSAQFWGEVTDTVARWIQEGPAGFSRPTNFGGGTGYMAPNMILVPEPSTAALLLVGLVGAGLRRRR